MQHTQLAPLWHISKQSRISLHLVVDQLSIAQDITSPVFMTALDHDSWAFLCINV